MRVDWLGNAVEVRQIGSGPTLILLHGYPLDGAMWSPVSRRLADRFRILKPDLPGRIENPAPSSGTVESYADFVESIVRAAGEPVGLAGFSMGGYVCLALMKRRPAGVRALALVDTRSVADDDAARENRDAAIKLLRESGVEPVAQAMLGKLLAPASLARRDLLDRVRRIMLRQPAAALESDLTAMRDRPDSTAFLKQIGIPTSVLVGERDTISSPAESRKMAEEIPGAGLVVIAEAGHLSPMENPDAVAQALGDFFAPLLARDPGPAVPR